MKISLNAKQMPGSYGGGNQFANNLEKQLSAAGHQVRRNLTAGLDLILIINAQPELKITSYTGEDIKAYCKANPDTVVVQRVNTCDEQRGIDQGINNAVLEANKVADHTVFVSNFMRDFYINKGYNPAKENSVILTGANREIFYPARQSISPKPEPLKIITHHWSTNFLKGFDIYTRLDQMLSHPEYGRHFSFTFVGNLPLGLALPKTEVYSPLSGTALGDKLREHHLYLSASRYEPGGNHYIEAMQCGLPVLFLNSGSLPEYCHKYGVQFNLADFEEKLLEVAHRYPGLAKKTADCDYSAAKTSAQYLKLFKLLVKKRHSEPRPKTGFSKNTAYHFYCLRKRLGKLRRKLADKIA